MIKVCVKKGYPLSCLPINNFYSYYILKIRFLEKNFMLIDNINYISKKKLVGIGTIQIIIFFFIYKCEISLFLDQVLNKNI